MGVNWFVSGQVSVTNCVASSRYDVVSIAKDKETAMVLQEGHGGWVTPMASVSKKMYFILPI